MPFKIIQTIENGKPQLSICPSKWEKGGLLRWPKKKAAKKSKIEELLPSADWIQIACVVKRAGIISYDAAEEELNLMLINTDTEEEVSNKREFKYMTENFNILAQQALGESVGTPVPVETPASSETTNTVIDNYVVIPEHDPTDNTAPEELASLANIMENQKVLFENQNNIIQNQQKIMMAMADFSTKLEKLFTVCKMLPVTAATVFNDKIKNTSLNTSFCLKPIQNENELLNLEEQLMHGEAKREYKNKYSIVCSPGKGINCAYQLVDVFFTREFLTKCSWSGSTRGEGTKISMKSYQNVLNLFFELVHDCDPSYTIANNNEFFKAVVKNSMKRKLSKLQRTPTSRNTTKRQKNIPVAQNTEDLRENIPNNSVPNAIDVTNNDHATGDANVHTDNNDTNQQNVYERLVNANDNI